MSKTTWAALAERTGFQPDTRFGNSAIQVVTDGFSDPIDRARAEGFATGFAEAEASGEARLDGALAARGKIDLVLARFSADQEEALRRHLHTALEVLWQAALAPLAVEPPALTNRIARAAAMLSRADDDRVLRLHPDDLALLHGALPPDLPIVPDLTLSPGSLRIETSQGGVEDGPEQWRQQLAEALAQC